MGDLVGLRRDRYGDIEAVSSDQGVSGSEILNFLQEDLSGLEPVDPID